MKRVFSKTGFSPFQTARSLKALPLFLSRFLVKALPITSSRALSRFLSKALSRFLSRALPVVLSLFFVTGAAAEGSVAQKLFVAGNLADKAKAVTMALGAEKLELAQNALTFSLNYVNILGSDDKDLAFLAESALEALSEDYIKNQMSGAERKELVALLYKLYTQFSLTALKRATLQKLAATGEKSADFNLALTSQVKIDTLDKDLMDCVIEALGAVGDSSTFNLLFSLLGRPAYEVHSQCIKKALRVLAFKNVADVATFIQKCNVAQCVAIFDICKPSQAAQSTEELYFVANIAENTLSRAVFIAENSNLVDEGLVSLLFDSYSFLVTLKWTRASHVAIRYLSLAKKLYTLSKFDSARYATVIKSLTVIAPLESSRVLIGFLEEANVAKAARKAIFSEDVVLAMIETLGALGDKSAFDALLAVTYHDYSSPVIAAAKSALAMLKW